MSQPSLKSQSDLEAEIRQALIRFEKEYMGRGPLETRVFFMEDMVIVRLEGVLIPTEIHLAQSADGRRLLKRVRTKLLEKGRPLLETVIRDILGVEVQSLHTDISTRTGERLIVFRLKKNLLRDSRRNHKPRRALVGNGTDERDGNGTDKRDGKHSAQAL
jgi:uncharacterized protein YbcI